MDSLHRFFTGLACIAGVLAALTLTSSGSAAAEPGRASLYLGGGVSLPFNMMNRYTAVGVGSMIGVGLRPFSASPEIEFVPRIDYDRFSTDRSAGGAYAFYRTGLYLKMVTEYSRPNRPFLTLGVGVANVRIGPSNGFPPFQGKSRRSTNVFGSGGFGYEIRCGKKVGAIASLELVDILDSLFGDYRFFRFSLGIRF